MLGLGGRRAQVERYFRDNDKLASWLILGSNPNGANPIVE